MVGGRAQLIGFHDSKLLTESVNPGGSGKSLHSTCALRVTPDDGRPDFESHMSVWGGDADRLQIGRWTYVLYDADKLDHCDLDKDRLAKEFGSVGGKHPVMVPRDVSNAWYPGNSGADSPSGPTVTHWGATSGQPPATPPTPDLADQLTKLADLRDRGVLSQPEFEAQKAKLLAQS
jgi:hypothetical protein